MLRPRSVTLDDVEAGPGDGPAPGAGESIEVEQSRPAVAAAGTGGSPAPATAEAAAALAADAARVAAARRLRPVWGSLPELDRLAALAAQLLGCASGRVSLLSDVQDVVGTAGPQPTGDGTGQPLEEWVCSLVAASGEPLLVADARADERVAALPPVRSGAVGSYLGVPLTTAGGQVVGAVCVFEAAARTWGDHDVALLQQIAAAAAAELELAALNTDYETNRALLELALQAGGVGTFSLDLATGQLTWDDQMHALFGVDRETFGDDLAAAYDRIHPEDRPGVQAAIDEAVAGGGTFLSTYRVLLPDGSTRWVQGRGRILRGADGAPVRLVGAAHDVSAEREATTRIATALESMVVGYLALDAQWRIVYANAEAERITGRPRAQLLERVLWEEFPATVGTVFEEQYRRAVDTGQPVSFDAHYPEPLDVWVEVRAVPQDGGLVLHFFDITARKQAQQAAEAAAARLALLAAVSTELTGTLDAEQAVARLAQLVVPVLADWCVVTLVDDAQAPAGAGSGGGGRAHRGLRDVGWWHHEEAARPLVQAYAAQRLPAVRDTSYLLQVLRSGRPVVLGSGAAASIAAMFVPGEAERLITELAPESAVFLPLRGRGRTVGLLSLFSSSGRAPMTAQALLTATEVAARAGLALDSSRLYRQQRDLAEGLQRSLLTEPVQPDHNQIVVRYVPAAEAAQVGGDWYDAFLQRGGATVLVIGDVIGHDIQAAAAMSQIRTLVRALGAVDDDAPATILRRTDEVMELLQVATTATAVVARLEQDGSQAARGVTRLRWSNAGHPPPMLLLPDGTVAPLLALSTDLLLGVLPGTPRRESEVVLDRGSTVLFYTDGLVERRDQPLQEGLERLQDTLEHLAGLGLDLDALCDRVLARMLPDQREDDVALLAVRLHPQDGPRPPEAGPHRIPPTVEDAPEVVPQPG